jgi:hypothetical protein
VAAVATEVATAGRSVAATEVGAVVIATKALTVEDQATEAVDSRATATVEEEARTAEATAPRLLQPTVEADNLLPQRLLLLNLPPQPQLSPQSNSNSTPPGQPTTHRTRPRTHTQPTVVLPRSWQLMELLVLPLLNPSSRSTPTTTRARWHRPDLRRMVLARRRLHRLRTALLRHRRRQGLLVLGLVGTAVCRRRQGCDSELE